MTQPVWTNENLDDPHAVADKAQRVKSMFSAIAPSYDINNRIHSLWRDQAWRRATVKQANVKRGDRVLDVACGTGDLALAFAANRKSIDGGPRSIVGVDFTIEMLAIARKKANRLRLASPVPMPTFVAGDAMQLPIADQSVDIVSIAFGIRNVADPAVAVDEIFRVLRPGGRVLILEFSLPRNSFLRRLYNFYFKNILPRTAALIARDRSGAYRYLPQSVNTFINRQEMVGMLESAGFIDVSVKPMTLGIAVLYRGIKK